MSFEYWMYTFVCVRVRVCVCVMCMSVRLWQGYFTDIDERDESTL